jgi:hypothetical protein
VRKVDSQNIISGLDRARAGIQKYADIMCAFRRVNVSENKEFQVKFNGFYKVRRNMVWRQEYYKYMEKLKSESNNFENILLHLKKALNKYEPSFSSKMLATHNPIMPIWDKYVLANFGLKAPAYTDNNNHAKAIKTYKELCGKYKDICESSQGRKIIELFNQKYPDMVWFSEVKKIDFVLWQIRN